MSLPQDRGHRLKYNHLALEIAAITSRRRTHLKNHTTASRTIALASKTMPPPQDRGRRLKYNHHNLEMAAMISRWCICLKDHVAASRLGTPP
jgi:hypothetical protein